MPLSDAYVQELFDHLQDHTITLAQCHELRRWIQEVYLSHITVVASIQKLAALHYINALESLMIELEHPL